MLNRTIVKGLLVVLAFALLPVGSASAADSSGAVVFSRVIAKTVKDAEGKETTTTEGGLYAVRDGRLNQLTEDPTDTEPAFSPDGRAIAFVHGGDIFSVRADGSGLRRLTSGSALDAAPEVSPNGRTVVFERRSAAGATADLYSASMLGGGTRELTSSPEDDHEASFSPDGRLIVFVRSVAETGGGTADDLYSVRSSGAGQARLTRTARLDEFDPRYFAGGIVYSRGESAEGPSAYADIYTMRRNGDRARPQVAGVGSAYVEDVSPSGHTVLFRREQGLWVKRIGPTRAQKLSELPDESQTNAVFSSDGRKVAAFIEADGREQLASIDVSSGSTRELAEGFEPLEPSTTPGTVTTLGPVITWQPVPRR
jgi:dipeptidyl aminopeptidase/acylaminoacyl peptidase